MKLKSHDRLADCCVAADKAAAHIYSLVLNQLTIKTGSVGAALGIKPWPYAFLKAMQTMFCL